MYEIFQGYEAFARAGYLAARSEKAEIGIGVLNSYSRHPAVTAMGLSFLSNMTGGRAAVVVGVGGDSWVGGMLGYDQKGSVQRFREYVSVLNRLLLGETVNLRSANFALNGVKLNPLPENPIPIIAACEQPKMMQVAGEIADGVYLEPSCCPIGYIKWAAKTATQSHKGSSEFRVIANLPIWITEDIEDARSSMKPTIAFHLSFPGEGELYLDKAGFPSSLAKEIGEVSGVRSRIRDGRALTGVFGSDGLKKAAQMVPNEFIDQCALIGDLKTCKNRLAELEKAGLTDVVFSFQDDRKEDLAILMGPR